MKIPKHMEQPGTVTLHHELFNWVEVTELEKLIQQAVEAGYSKERMSIEYEYDDGMYLKAFRIETPEEHQRKIDTWIAAQKEAKKQKRKQTDAEEKALYLRLKKKFEKGTV